MSFCPQRLFYVVNAVWPFAFLYKHLMERQLASQRRSLETHPI
jgi:hypothetical protein